MELPEDTDQLKQLLEKQSRRFRRAIEDSARLAEKAKLEGRRAVLVEYVETISDQSARLHALGMEADAAEARGLAKAAREELGRIERRLGELKQEPQPAPIETPVEESAPQEEALPQAEALPDDEPEVPEDRLNDLVDRVTNLNAGADQLHDDELRCRMNILAGELRILQDEYPRLRENHSPDGRRLHSSFGMLTRLATEREQFVYGLKREHDKDWHEHVREWEENLRESIEQRREQEKAAREEDAERKRRAELSERNRAARNELYEELRELLSDDSPDAAEIVELTAEMLRAHDSGQSPEDRLVQLLLPHAEWFDDKGGDFRGLRKAFKRRGKPIGDEPGAGASAARVEASDEFKGWFKGRRGAIIGGNLREHRRGVLEEYYGFDELDWIESERNHSANTRALAARIENRHYDIVLLLKRFCSHSLHDAVKGACKSSGVPFVLVESGYGRRRVSEALRALGDYLPRSQRT